MTGEPVQHTAAENVCDDLDFACLLTADDAPARIRAALLMAEQARGSRFWADISAHRLVGERAVLVDRLLISLWAHFELSGEGHIALVAVGGYGRKELHPGSDIDLMVLLTEAPGAQQGEKIQQFLTFLWDVGLEPGHSVRTVADCVQEATGDITVATSLMESRLLTGPAGLFHEMRHCTGRNAIWDSAAFFSAKSEEQVARHHKFHDTAYNLEPNIKEGPGGLRDIQMIGWVVKRHFYADSYRELLSRGFLTEPEYDSLVAGQNFLWRIRYALHLVAGRREDRLLFDYQRELATRLGYRDQPEGLAVEQLMQDYFRTVRELRCLNEVLLALFREFFLHGSDDAEVIPINKRFQVRNGLLEVVDDAVFRRRPLALLEMFLVLQSHPGMKGVHPETIRLVRDHCYLIDDNFRDDPKAHALFLRIVRQKRGVAHGFRRMHRYGVLSAYLPIFARIVGQMQYDLFHAYTVDDHTLRVVRNLRELSQAHRYLEFPHCMEVFKRLPRPELLYLAGLLHDIAKGRRGGQHAQQGAVEALRFGEHHGLASEDSELISWLVRHHLLMSMTAQKQDIGDPKVVRRFSMQMGSRNRLDHLYLLTVADIRATNPELWNGWKETLLKDLYEAAAEQLECGTKVIPKPTALVASARRRARELLLQEGGDETAIEGLWSSLGNDYFLRTVPEDIVWQTLAILQHDEAEPRLVLLREISGGTEVFVYTRDQDYLFAATTALFNGLGLNVLVANVHTTPTGMSVDTYIVLEAASGAPVTDAHRRSRVWGRLRQALLHPQEVACTEMRMPQRRYRHFLIPTRVDFFSEEALLATRMEVVSADRPGLLSRIGRVLVENRVHLTTARIATLGERAEDYFLLKDDAGQPLDETAQAGLRACLVAELDTPA